MATIPTTGELVQWSQLGNIKTWILYTEAERQLRILCLVNIRMNAWRAGAVSSIYSMFGADRLFLSQISGTISLSISQSAQLSTKDEQSPSQPRVSAVMNSVPAGWRSQNKTCDKCAGSVVGPGLGIILLVVNWFNIIYMVLLWCDISCNSSYSNPHSPEHRENRGDKLQ